MSGKRILMLTLVALVVFLLARWALDGGKEESTGSGEVARAMPIDPQAFTRAEGPRAFAFPQDHGPHLDYQTEWWYYTGNLEAEDGRRFGYQLTFFRRALVPPEQTPLRSSGWAASQVYMAHFAITDVSGGQHRAFERLARGAAGLAGAQAQPFAVWLEDWRVEQVPTEPETCSAPQANPCAYRLVAAQDDLSLELKLVDRKGAILQGDAGLSRKGQAPGQASYYYSLTRLESSGVVQVAGESYSVRGWSWMDHEFSTSALSQDQVGWDWFSIQLDDNSEIMLFQIRRLDGSIDPFSSGTIISPDGKTVGVEAADFQVQVLNQWKSPRSQAVYPAGWRITIPGQGLTLEITPYLADQELNVSYAYWEGAVKVTALRNGESLMGSGYVELTGYSRSMGGEF